MDEKHPIAMKHTSLRIEACKQQPLTTGHTVNGSTVFTICRMLGAEKSLYEGKDNVIVGELIAQNKCLSRTR